MIEPTLALQTAIRSALISTPEVTALVPADHVRAASARPDKLPCIVMSDGNTTLHGQDYTAQRAAWVYLDLHVWTINTGTDAAKEIAFAACNALDRPLHIEGGFCDHFKVTRTVYPRDPDPAYGHGVISVAALVRWIV